MIRTLILIYSFIIIIIQTSCSFIFKKAIGLKNPKVETRQSITEHLNKNNIGLSNHFFFQLRKDSAEIYKTILNGLKKEMLIFDKVGKKCCYLGNEKCKGKQFSKTITEFDSFYKPCLNKDSMTFPQLKAKLIPLSVEASQNNPEYYIVVFWNKYLGKQHSIREDYEWINRVMDKSWG